MKTAHLIACLMIGLIAGVISDNVSAAASADATIFNRATLTYSGGSVTAGVSVQVALQAAAPTLSAPADAAVSSGAATEYLYTIIGNANGQDTYSLASASVDATDSGTLGAPGMVFYSGTTGSTPIVNVTLGGAITADVSIAGAIRIPAGSEVNITNGSILRIPADPGTGFPGGRYLVTGIIPGVVPTLATAEVLSQITLTPQPGSPAIGAGDIVAGVQVGEQKEFRLSVTGGVITGTPTTATHTVTLTTTSTANPAITETDETVTTVTAVSVDMTKDVAIWNADPDVSTQTYPGIGTPVDSGTILIYRITVGPAAAQPAITSAVITDAVPAYTTYIADTTTLNNVYVNTIPAPVTDGGVLPTIAGLTVNSPNSGIDDGSGADGTGEAGVVDAAATAVTTFRVTVD